MNISLFWKGGLVNNNTIASLKKHAVWTSQESSIGALQC